MSFYYYYYKNVLKREFLTRYVYENVYQLPKMKKIVLSLSFSQISLRGLLPLLSALTLISSQKSYLLNSSRPIVLLRLKSGLPIGCRVDLRGQQLFFFFEKLNFSVLPRLKDFSLGFRKNILFLSIPSLSIFKEIEKDYEYFTDMPSLNIVFVFATSNRKREIVDFLTAFRFPFKRCVKF